MSSRLQNLLLTFLILPALLGSSLTPSIKEQSLKYAYDSARVEQTIKKSYSTSEGFYEFPIYSGKRSYLTGNFGELRSGHFHAGIDIKTKGRSGDPVYAAADGFISRIKVSPHGYGNAIYIQHPNNKTTVYAHLKDFNSKIKAHVLDQQYKEQSFDINLFPEKSEFPVKKGELIGEAGNSGSSTGPHLHFEIRDAYQRPQNPLNEAFAKEAIVDTRKPEIRKIAFVTLEKSARINGKFGWFEFDPDKQADGQYKLPEPIYAKGKIGVEIKAYDRANGTHNIYGVNTSKLFLNDSLIQQITLNNFAFSQTKDIRSFINYKVRQSSGARFYKLYKAPGLDIPIYQNNNEKDGILTIKDTSSHLLNIEVKDDFNNASTLKANITGKTHKETAPQYDNVTVEKYDPNPLSQLFSGTGPDLSHEVIKNTLKMEASVQLPQIIKDSSLKVYINNRSYILKPDYGQDNKLVYLWNLKNGLPDSAKLESFNTLDFHFQTMVPSGHKFSFYHPRMEVYFSQKDLFDTLYLQSAYKQNEETDELFYIHNKYTPLRRNVNIKLKPLHNFSMPSKVGAYQVSKNNNYQYKGGSWTQGGFRFSTQQFGKFTLKADTVDPSITPLVLNNQKVKFKIEDELSGIDSYDVHLNNKWLLMEYDNGNSTITSKRKDKTKPLKGLLKVKIKDNAGNSTLYETRL